MDSPLVKDISLFLDDKPSVFALRQKAKTALLTTGFPTAKTEAWKYTNLKKLLQTPFNVNTKEEPCDHECGHHHNSNIPFIEITFCHGKLHIEEYNTPIGLQITPLPIALYENEYKNYLQKIIYFRNLVVKVSMPSVATCRMWVMRPSLTGTSSGSMM